MLLHFALLSFAAIVDHYTVKICGNPALSKFLGMIFFSSIYSLTLSVLHFGNSYNIPSFFIIIILGDLCYGDL